MRNEAMTRDRESGVALLSAILVLMLMSALLVGFIAMVNADQSASGINRDQTQAYAAAHAGVEKLTADLGSCSRATSRRPATRSTRWRTPAMRPCCRASVPDARTGTRAIGSPSRDDDPSRRQPGHRELPTGRTSRRGRTKGWSGSSRPTRIEVTARTAGNAEVRMRREMQTVGIPVFQFGIFSENDLSFFAGPNFDFGGRVHSNQHLWLKQDGGNTLTLRDRVTAVGEIVRDRSPTARTPHRVGPDGARGGLHADAAGGDRDPCRNLLATEGSASRHGSRHAARTGVDGHLDRHLQQLDPEQPHRRPRRLSLPLVSDGATPIDIIRRPPAGEDPDSSLGQQRFYNMATLRILLSDRAADLTALPDAVGTPIRLANPTPGLSRPGRAAVHDHSREAAVAGSLPAGNYNFAESTGVVNNGFRTANRTSSIDGYILINRQARNGIWTDVTKEILNLGFAGRRLSRTTTRADLHRPHRHARHEQRVSRAAPQRHHSPPARPRHLRRKSAATVRPTAATAAGHGPPPPP